MPDLATKLVQANFPGFPNGGSVPAGSRVEATLSQPVFNVTNGKAEDMTVVAPINPATGDMGFWDTVGTPAAGLRLFCNDDPNAKPQGTYWKLHFVIPGQVWPDLAVVVSTGDTDPVLLSTLAQPVGGIVAYGVQFDDGTTTLPNVTRVTVTNGSLSGTGNHATVATGGGGGGSAHIIEDEGTPLTARAKLNFIGAGVTATDNAGAGSTDITIPSGGPPTGAAGGDLSSTYPNPTLANTSTARDNLGLALVGTLLGAVARTIIRKAGTLIGTRRAINLIEGTNITLTVADNAGTEAVDVTITAAGGGGGMTNPMTTEGDQIVGGAAGAPGRVAVGAADRVWKSNGTDPAWTDQATIKATGTTMDFYTGGVRRMGIDDVATKLTVLLNNMELGASGNTLFDLYGTILTGYLGVTLVSQAATSDISLKPIRAVFIQNSNVVPAANPVGGGFLYCEGGSLKFRGSSGTITVLAPA